MKKFGEFLNESKEDRLDEGRKNKGFSNSSSDYYETDYKSSPRFDLLSGFYGSFNTFSDLERRIRAEISADEESQKMTKRVFKSNLSKEEIHDMQTAVVDKISEINMRFGKDFEKLEEKVIKNIIDLVSSYDKEVVKILKGAFK